MNNNQQEVDPAEEMLRNRRNEHVQHIRKETRNEIITKKRNINFNVEQKNVSEIQNQYLEVNKDDYFSNKISEYAQRSYSSQQFMYLVQCIGSQDIQKIHFGVIGIRKLLSVQENPPIQMVIDSNLVPKFIQFMKQTKYPHLQMQATWALTNIASGSSLQCQSIIDKGGIPLFVKLLSSPNYSIAEQAVWAIGNIAGDCSLYRDLILKAGGLEPMIKLVQTCPVKGIVKQSAWALSNLCRGNPLPKYDLVKQAIPTLARVIKSGEIDDLDIITDCCWAISYMSDGARSKIQKIVETGITQKLVTFLSTDNLGLLIPSLRTLGNIATGNQLQTDEILKCNAIPYFEELLNHSKKVVRRQTCWTLSNIAAGVLSQVQRIINNKSLVTKLLLLWESDAIDVKKEIAWIFTNITNSGNIVEVYTFYKEYQILQYYVKMLKSEDLKAVEVALDGIKNMLEIGEKVRNPNSINNQNPFVIELHTIDAINDLEELQYSPSNDIYLKVSKILNEFFELEDPLA